MNQEIEAALKTIMVYLASLNLKNNLILDRNLIAWFNSKKYRFEVFKEGISTGTIYLDNDTIKLNIDNIHQALVSLNDPYKLTFSRKINTMFLQGDFIIKKELDYLIILDCLLENSDCQIKFTMNKDSLFNALIATVNYAEKLIINPREYLISYSYEGKDLKHQVNYEALVQGIVPCMLKKPNSFIGKTKSKFNDTVFETKDYYQNLQNDALTTLMYKLYPHYQNPIKEINNWLNNWLANLLKLSYSNEEIIQNLGLENGNGLINNKTLREFMETEKVKNLILERKKYNAHD